MSTVLVPACLESDFDAGAGTCTQVIWIPQPTVIPELSVEDAQQIGLSVALLLAAAFVLRQLRKFLEQA